MFDVSDWLGTVAAWNARSWDIPLLWGSAAFVLLGVVAVFSACGGNGGGSIRVGGGLVAIIAGVALLMCSALTVPNDVSKTPATFGEMVMSRTGTSSLSCVESEYAKQSSTTTGGAVRPSATRSSYPTAYVPYFIPHYDDHTPSPVNLDTFSLPSDRLLSCAFKTADGKLHAGGSMVIDRDARQVGLYLPDGSPAGTGLKEK